MKKKSFIPRSISTRIFITFLVIMIPFEIIGIFIFTWAQNTIQKEIEASATSQVNFLCYDFENKIQNISAQLLRLSLNNQIHHFSRNYEQLSVSEFYISLKEQSQIIESIPHTFPLLNDVIIYYHGLDKALSANKGYFSISKNTYQDMTSKLTDFSLPMKHMDSDLLVGIIYPVNSVINNTEPIFLISMELSKKDVENYLSSFSNYDTVLLDHSTMQPLYGSTQNNMTSEEYEDHFNTIDQNLTTGNNTTFSIRTDEYFIIADYSQYLNTSFIQFVPLSEIMILPRQYSFYLTIFTLCSFLIVIIYYFISRMLINRPVTLLLNAFHKIETGDFDIELTYNYPAKEYMLLFDGFNNMAKRLNESIDQLYKLEIFSQRIELKQLQMQINPHFLYNSYFVLHRLIAQEDLANAKQLSSYMGKYFQYITRNAQDKVPLKQEWEHAKNYLEIQSIRYSMRITIKVDECPLEYSDFLVPRLIFQPILENVFEHGLNDKVENGLLELRFFTDNDSIYIQIKDNGDSLNNLDIDNLRNLLEQNKDPQQETTALVNVHRRLQLEYGSNSGIVLSRNIPNGLIVDLKIQKNTSKDNGVMG